MFEIERTSVKFNGVELKCYVRQGTLDLDLIKSANEYKFERFNLKDNDTIIDIGAYNGGEALYFMSMLKNFNYIGYEPIPENWELAVINLAINQGVAPGSYRIFENSIADQMSYTKIYYGDIGYTGEGGGWGEKLHFMGNIKAPYRSSSAVNSRSISLNEVFKFNKITRAKLIKIDTEGAEVPILEGASIDVLKSIDYIVGELHDKSLSDIEKATRGLFHARQDKHLFYLTNKRL